MVHTCNPNTQETEAGEKGRKREGEEEEEIGGEI